MTYQPIIGPEDIRAIKRDPDLDPAQAHRVAQKTGDVFEGGYRGDGL